MSRWIGVWGAAALLLVAGATAAPPEIDLSGRHAVFDVLKPDVAQELLDQATAAGFHVVDLQKGFRHGWTVGGYAALLARTDEGAPACRLLLRDKPEWIADGLNEAAMQGYRLVPGRFFAMRRGTKPFQDEEFVLLLERAPPDAGQRYYMVLFDDDIRGEALRLAAQRGYEVVGFAAGRDRPVAVLEVGFRPEGPDAALDVPEPYRLLQVATTGTLRRRLKEGVADGYRLVGAARPGGDAFYLLRHDPGAAPISYVLPEKKERIDAMNRAGAEGARLLPFTWGEVPVQERREADRSVYAYRLIGEADPDDSTPADLDRLLTAAAVDGFQPLLLTAPLQALGERVTPR